MGKISHLSPTNKTPTSANTSDNQQESDDNDELNSIDDQTATKGIIEQAKQTTEDFIIKQLYGQINPYEFEGFVAHLLECAGYKARVSSKSRDGGVDVIAHKDEFGFEPPIIKVQCKQMTSKTGAPEVRQLLGTLGEGEFGLFVNLGDYTNDALLEERMNPKLRLIGGEEVVHLVQQYYEQLSPKYRNLIPLYSTYMVDLSLSS